VPRHNSASVVLRLLVVAVLATWLVAGCGSSGEHTAHDGAQSGVTTDRAFLNDMTPHHQLAIKMAEIAQQRAEHVEVKQVAASIVADQQGEVEEMSELRLQTSAGDDSSHLGMSEREMGMSSDAHALTRAKPFDRAFIDAMVHHHQGAIAMAKAELAKGRDPQVRSLARRIIDQQQREIAQMNAWRKRWYGAPVPKSSPPHSGGHEM
jgi:uncharacterized protein (DUF305 family)